jgi:soluble lytic murein transglycosylase-like protein
MAKGLGFGTALLGVSQGFNQYQQQQYQNQQQQQLQNAQIQQMQANTDQIRTKTSIEQEQVAQEKAAREMMPKAWQYAKDSLSQLAAPSDSYNQPTQANLSQAQPASLGGMAQQADQPQKSKGALLDALKLVESGGNPNAISKAGAKGPYQFMDATAKQYGVQDPFNEDQSRAGADKMLSHLTEKYGDTTKALQAYNWGEGNMDAYIKTGKGAKGQPMPQETQDYAGKVLNKANKITDPELVGPAATAANNLRTASGKVPDDIRNTAVKQQKSIADTLDKMSEFYMMNGNVEMADQFSNKAQKARAIEVQQRQEAYKEKKDSIGQIGSMVSTVNSQSDWTGTLSAIKADPVMRANLQGLNITGVYEQDKHAIDALKQRTLTVKDQEELKLKGDSADIKNAQVQMKQQQFDMNKTREDAFVESQMMKANQARAAGVPKEPVSTGLMDPKTRPNVMRALTASNVKDATADNSSVVAGRQGLAIVNQLDSLLKSGLRTGPVEGRTIAKMTDAGQQFDKLSADLVLMMQDSRSGVSSKTAAMFKNISVAKPELTKNPEANEKILSKIKANFQEDQNRIQFKNEFAKYNDNRLDAEKWYDNYSARYPLYIPDPSSTTGEYKLDTRRPTWQQYFKKAD